MKTPEQRLREAVEAVLRTGCSENLNTGTVNVSRDFWDARRLCVSVIDDLEKAEKCKDEPITDGEAIRALIKYERKRADQQAEEAAHLLHRARQSEMQNDELRKDRARLRFMSELWIPSVRPDDPITKWILIGDHVRMCDAIDAAIAAEIATSRDS